MASVFIIAGYIVCSKYLHTLKISYDCVFFSIWKKILDSFSDKRYFLHYQKFIIASMTICKYVVLPFWQSKYYSITWRHFHKSNTSESKLLRWDINIFTLQIHKMFSCSSIMKRLKKLNQIISWNLCCHKNWNLISNYFYSIVFKCQSAISTCQSLMESVDKKHVAISTNVLEFT